MGRRLRYEQSTEGLLARLAASHRRRPRPARKTSPANRVYDVTRLGGRIKYNDVVGVIRVLLYTPKQAQTATIASLPKIQQTQIRKWIPL